LEIARPFGTRSRGTRVQTFALLQSPNIMLDWNKETEVWTSRKAVGLYNCTLFCFCRYRTMVVIHSPTLLINSDLGLKKRQ